MLLAHSVSFGVFLISAGLLAGCKKDSDAIPEEPSTGLAGTWKLTARQCFCSPQLPNEIIKFTDTGFSFYTNGQPTVYGNYSITSGGNSCSGPAPVPVVRFAYVNAGATLQNAVFTLHGNHLVLDYGGCLDAPVNTYERLR